MPRPPAIFGVLQGTPNDGLYSIDAGANLTPREVPNPRTELESQTVSNAALGIAAVRP